jgi:flagellar biosynthesis/type III secretory pathway protein FliH
MRGLLAAALAIIQPQYRTDTEPSQAEREAIDERRAQLDEMQTQPIEPEPDADDREYSTLQAVAEKLIEYRKREGVAAEVIVRMALKIGYESGKDTGRAEGYRAGVDAWMHGGA